MSACRLWRILGRGPRTPRAGRPIGVVKKFGDKGAGKHAALLAYYGFFSVFPLLLVFTTVIGYALANAGRAGARRRQPVTWRRAYGRLPAGSALEQTFADRPCTSCSTALAGSSGGAKQQAPGGAAALPVRGPTREAGQTSLRREGEGGGEIPHPS